ncbi:hypothetical protein D3C85_1715990 [compost metagenome]
MVSAKEYSAVAAPAIITPVMRIAFRWTFRITGIMMNRVTIADKANKLVTRLTVKSPG